MKEVSRPRRVVEQAKEPWPPDGLHHYSFGTF